MSKNEETGETLTTLFESDRALYVEAVLCDNNSDVTGLLKLEPLLRRDDPDYYAITIIADRAPPQLIEALKHLTAGDRVRLSLKRATYDNKLRPTKAGSTSFIPGDEG